MNPFFLTSLFLLATLFISSCGGNTLWTHPSKSLTDLHIDDRECAKLAQAKAGEQSLVKQPNIHVLQRAYGQCMISQGWATTSTEQRINVTAKPITIDSSEDSIQLTSGNTQIRLTGPIQIISQDQHSALFKQDGQYLYLNLQDNSPLTFLSTYPELLPEAKLFDKHRNKNILATFYYKEVNKKLIFGGMAYIFPKKNSRIVVSITKEIFIVADEFLEISRQDFDQLLNLQDAWIRLIEDIYDQSRHSYSNN